ncbi:MAG: diguanylate cyclase [Sulfurimonas sp.]|jgi:diguanylate cyclase (GGDEF)-like protein
MKLRSKLLLTLSILFVFFTLIIWFFTHIQSENANERWGAKFVQNQIIFDKYRTLLPIIHDISLVKQLAQEPAIIAMALYENDPKIRSDGLKTLERYRIQFQDQTYFAAFSKSKNYYFNDSNNTYGEQNPLYKVSSKEPRDQWFFGTISMGEPFQINIDKDRFLGVTKVWIDYAIRDKGKIIGVIGTGFDFDRFLKNSIGFEQGGSENYFIKKDLSIQLAKDAGMIDYTSFTKKDGTHKTIESVITDPLDIEHIKEMIRELEVSKNPNLTKTLWVNIKGEKCLLGIGYTREIEWFSVTLFHSDELSLVNNKTIFNVMSLLFFISIGVLGFRLRQAIVSPIEKLMENIDRVRKWDNESNFPVVGSGEIAELSKRFNDLVKEIKQHETLLEAKIQERTEELMKSEAKLQALAFYDALTNLPNRRLLADRLSQAQVISKRSGCYGSVLFMDLDNFKPLNDTYGHTIGDLLLVEVAHRLKTCVRERDTVARFGGDEFIVLLSELSSDKETSKGQAIVIAEKIRHLLSHPYLLKISSDTIVEHHCTASIGLTLFLGNDATEDEIFSQADNAMYQAKEQGRNTVLVY